MLDRPGTRAGLALIGTAMLSACATLDREECINADWRLIGYEDGAQGRSTAYLGNHREACAEHRVRPDMDAYLQGHEEGLAPYCRPAKAYRLGRSGGHYPGVCPTHLRPELLSAYQDGKDIYELEHRIKRAHARKNKKTQQLAGLKQQFKDKETELIAKGTAVTRRLQLLSELRDLSKTQGTIEAEIHEIEMQRTRLRQRLDLIKKDVPYG
jgi:hypothetical protein